MLNVGRLCRENFWKVASEAKSSPVRTLAAASAAFIVLACLFPRGRACFRWSVGLVTSAGSSLFSRLSSFRATQQTEEKVTLTPSERAITILKDRGKYSASLEEISACIEMSETLRNQLLDPEKSPEELCPEIEKGLYQHAKTSLQKEEWDDRVIEIMKWVEILANLNKKPAPYQQGYKAMEIAKQSLEGLSHRKMNRSELYQDMKASSATMELFPLANFLVEKFENKWNVTFDSWNREQDCQFYETLSLLICERKHGIISLDLLEELTEQGYTLEEIDSANTYMIEHKDPDRIPSREELLSQSLAILKKDKIS